MEVDESFTEYVGTRWSMLYRLATLLVGDTQADEVTEAALLRAYLSWRDVQEAVSPDPVVKKLLVSTAVATLAQDLTSDVRPTSSTSAIDREALWSRITALPPRQRALVVLLDYEDVSEREAARLLGCSTSTVRTEALAALASPELAEFTPRDVREELLRRAEEVVVPLPPVDTLLPAARAAHRRRRQRALGWWGTVVAVAVIGVVVAAVVGGAEPEPVAAPARPASSTQSPVLGQTLATLPEGAPPTVAYSVGRVLHLDGHEVRLSSPPSAIAETRRHVFLAYRTGVIEQVSRATQRVETLTRSAAGPMVTDPSGRHVAWPVVARRTATVVLRSYVGGRASHRERDFPARPRCCADPFVVNGITAAGELVASSPAANKAWIWNIQGRQLRQIDGVGHGTVGEIAVNGIVVEHPRSHYAFGDVRDGAFRRTASFRTHTAYFGDPLGRRLVYVDEAGEIYVRQRVARRGRRFGPNLVRLELPAITAGFAAARWEDTEHVLLDVFDIYLPEGALVRCQVLTGACEIAARLVGPHVVAR